MGLRPSPAAIAVVIAVPGLLGGQLARAQQLQRTIIGGASRTRFGESVANAGDLDGDQFDDLLVGEPLYDDVANARLGRVCVYSGATGGLLRIHPAITTN